MKLRNVSKLFPDLNKYKTFVRSGSRIFTVEDLKSFPQYLDKDIKSIRIAPSILPILQVRLEIEI